MSDTDPPVRIAQSQALWLMGAAIVGLVGLLLNDHLAEGRATAQRIASQELVLRKVLENQTLLEAALRLAEEGQHRLDAGVQSNCATNNAQGNAWAPVLSIVPGSSLPPQYIPQPCGPTLASGVWPLDQVAQNIVEALEILGMPLERSTLAALWARMEGT